jgi:hypothetical protein
MDAEQKLAALWAEAEPPARDPAFAIAVIARIERRRLWGELLDLAPLVVALGVLAWALAPRVETMLRGDLAGLGAGAFLAAASVLAGIWLVVGALRAVAPPQSALS